MGKKGRHNIKKPKGFGKKGPLVVGQEEKNKLKGGK